MDEGPELDELPARREQKAADKLSADAERERRELSLIESDLSEVAAIKPGRVIITDSAYATTENGYKLLHVPN